MFGAHLTTAQPPLADRAVLALLSREASRSYGGCRERAGGTGRDGSDPPVRGPGTGSGPGVLAHPSPRPLGSLACQQSLREGCRAPLRSGGGPVGRPAGHQAVRHRRACPGLACSGPPFAFPHGMVGPERPLAGKGEGVNARSPLCRTKPSGRGVAPATAKAARSATDDRVAWPQDIGSAADTGLPPCESPGSRNVNRPPASFSHRGAA